VVKEFAEMYHSETSRFWPTSNFMTVTSTKQAEYTLCAPDFKHFFRIPPIEAEYLRVGHNSVPDFEMMASNSHLRDNSHDNLLSDAESKRIAVKPGLKPRTLQFSYEFGGEAHCGCA
jgi:hypothetical protein